MTIYKVIKNQIIKFETGIESRAKLKAQEINADSILKITTEKIKF